MYFYHVMGFLVTMVTEKATLQKTDLPEPISDCDCEWWREAVSSVNRLYICYVVKLAR